MCSNASNRSDVLDRPRVLVVDDDEGFASSLVEILEMQDCRAMMATNSGDALRIVESNEIHIALLDVFLGQESGISLIGPFKQLRPQILCMMVTAVNDVDAAIESLHQGAYDYLRKPLDFRTLFAAIDRCVERLRLERDRTEAQEKLRQMNAELARKNAEMEQFICTVSHDLRSPLVTLQGFANHLRQDVSQGRTDRLSDYAQRMQAATARMASLIDDLLDLSRIGRIENEPEPVSLTVLARNICGNHESLLAGQNVSVQIQGDMPTVSVDKDRMTQVLDNLILNAIKYGCRGDESRIEIGSEDGDGDIRVYVRDYGPGIPANMHGRVFEVFRRLHQDKKGAGVGLAIVKRIVEVHGGRVWIESGREAGATFWLGLPGALRCQPIATCEG